MVPAGLYINPARPQPERHSADCGAAGPQVVVIDQQIQVFQVCDGRLKQQYSY